MNKKEDEELLELQEKAMKRVARRSFNHKDLQTQKLILSAYLDGNVKMSELSARFNVHPVTIYRWINKFAEGKARPREKRQPKPKKQNYEPMKKPTKPHEDPQDELERLREENKHLAEALKMAEWSSHAKDVMIDIAEKTFNIPIRKKSGAKQ